MLQPSFSGLTQPTVALSASLATAPQLLGIVRQPSYGVVSIPIGSMGTRKGGSRPISALLNGSKELADLVSASKPRYGDQLQAPSLEPSAEVLHGVFALLLLSCLQSIQLEAA